MRGPARGTRGPVRARVRGVRPCGPERSARPRGFPGRGGRVVLRWRHGGRARRRPTDRSGGSEPVPPDVRVVGGPLRAPARGPRVGPRPPGAGPRRAARRRGRPTSSTGCHRVRRRRLRSQRHALRCTSSVNLAGWRLRLTPTKRSLPLALVMTTRGEHSSGSRTRANRQHRFDRTWAGVQSKDSPRKR